MLRTERLAGQKASTEEGVSQQERAEEVTVDSHDWRGGSEAKAVHHLFSQWAAGMAQPRKETNA